MESRTLYQHGGWSQHAGPHNTNTIPVNLNLENINVPKTQFKSRVPFTGWVCLHVLTNKGRSQFEKNLFAVATNAVLSFFQSSFAINQLICF